jgi:CheY-like chemotaxis protein
MDHLGPPRPLDIVLAEDDKDLARMNRHILESAGHNVNVTGDGAATLEAVRSTEPDLLILDMEMPRGNGIEVLEELRSEPATKSQPVVVMSNKDLTAADERRLVRLGALDFLAKWKVEPKVLVGWIRGWAAGQARRLALQKHR